MIANCLNKCGYCGSPIEPGQRWVREKVFEVAITGRDPSYQRYHAELFSGQELSCWEKHQMAKDTALNHRRAA